MLHIARRWFLPRFVLFPFAVSLTFGMAAIKSQVHLFFWGNGCAAPRAMGISIFFFNFAAHPRKKCLLLVRFVPRKKRQEHFHFRFGVRTHAPFAYYNFVRERGFPQLFLRSREKKQKVKIRKNGGEKRNIPPPRPPPVRYDIFHMQERKKKKCS